jgi:hypothetical protein
MRSKEKGMKRSEKVGLITNRKTDEEKQTKGRKCCTYRKTGLKKSKRKRRKTNVDEKE